MLVQQDHHLVKHMINKPSVTINRDVAIRLHTAITKLQILLEEVGDKEDKEWIKQLIHEYVHQIQLSEL